MLSRTLPPPPTRRLPRDPYDISMVCHAFVSITFAFSCYSRSVEARNWSKRNRNPNRSNMKIRKSINIFRENRKPNAKKRKIRKPQWTPKPRKRSFLAQKPKTDLKNSQNRKTENPSAALDKQETHIIKDISRISVHAQKSPPPKKRPPFDHTVKHVPHLNKCPPTPPSS